MRKPPVKEKRLDSLNRRLYHTRQPKGKEIILTPTDIIRLEFLHRHGDLPTRFIHEYTKELVTNERSTVYRLGHLFHEDDTGWEGPLIDRPPQQWAGQEKPNKNQLVHRASRHAIKALQHAGRFHEDVPKTSSKDNWKHDFMRACYTASVDLAATEKPDEYGFIHHDTVIRNAIKTTGSEPVFEAGGENFRPDALFGIQYKKEELINLFAVEIDRGTEDIKITAKNKDGKSIEKSLKQYREYIKTGKYKKYFPEVNSFMLITITVSYRRAKNMKKVADDEPFFLFNWMPGFDFFMTPPKPMPHFFTEGNARSGHPEFNISTP